MSEEFLRQVKITNDGTPMGTHVIDTQTGKEMQGVFEITWHQDFRSPGADMVPRATIKTYCMIEVEGQADVITICPRCEQDAKAQRDAESMTATYRIEQALHSIEAVLGQYPDDGDWHGCVRNAREALQEAIRSAPPGTSPRVPNDSYRKCRLPSHASLPDA